MNVKPTTEIIRQMADSAACLNIDLTRYADFMERNQSFDYAPEVIMTITNFISNLRLDLIVARPIREYERGRIAKERKNSDKAS